MEDCKNKQYISIIIPALNEESYIRQCLKAINDMDFREDQYEVIVVDNGSFDATIEIAESFKAQVLIKLDGTIGSLRNYGAKHARGDIIGFIDADCQVEKDWLKNAVKHLDNPEVAAVGSRLDHIGNTWVSKCWSLMHSEKKTNGEVDWLPSGNMIVVRKYFDELEGFDEKLTTSEDYDLCLRLRLKGYKIFSDPKINSIHLAPPKTLFEFYKKEIWHGQEMLNTFSKKKVSSAFIYAIFYLICIIGMLLGFTLSLTIGNHSVLFLSVSTSVIAPLFLAIKTANHNKNYRYVVALMMMYLVYGIARSLSLVKMGKLIRHKKHKIESSHVYEY